MLENVFNKFYWGFFFIMIDFRLQGVDIFPDIAGYLFLAAGFGLLVSSNVYFDKAKSLNIFMIFLSIFQIYERPAQGSGINFGALGSVGFLIGIAATVLNLFVIYNLFMGISDMARLKDQIDIREEAERRWTHYLVLQLAGLFSIILLIIPPIAMIFVIVLLVITIVLAIVIMGFMKRCGTSL